MLNLAQLVLDGSTRFNHLCFTAHFSIDLVPQKWDKFYCYQAMSYNGTLKQSPVVFVSNQTYWLTSGNQGEEEELVMKHLCCDWQDLTGSLVLI